MADAQASGACYGNIVRVQVPSPAWRVRRFGCGLFFYVRRHERRCSKQAFYYAQDHEAGQQTGCFYAHSEKFGAAVLVKKEVIIYNP